MKILVVSNSFPRKDNPTLCKYELDQLVELNKIPDVDIKVLYALPRIPKLFLRVLPGNLQKKAKGLSEVEDEYEISGIRVKVIRCLHGYGSMFFYHMPRIILFLFQHILPKAYRKTMDTYRPDIIYGVGPLWEGQLVKKLAKRWDVPYVMIEHSSSVLSLASSKKYLKKAYASTVQTSAATIFVSTSQRRDFYRSIEEVSNAKVILNGFEGVKSESPKLKRDDGPIRIVSVGFLEKRKGHHVLIDACGQLHAHGKEFVLRIIGDGSERSALEAQANALGIGKYVEFLGRVSHEEVLRTMRESDVFALLSYDEPFGIVYLEAMSVGLPVLGTKGEGIEDVVVHGENGFLIDKNDSDAAGKIIIQLMEDETFYKKVSEAGMEATKKLTWAHNAKNTYELFESILESE